MQKSLTFDIEYWKTSFWKALIHVYLYLSVRVSKLAMAHKLQNKSKTKWQDVEHCWKWDSYQIFIALMALRM